MELYIKRNFEDSEGYYNNHGFGKPGDSGLDLFFPEDVVIPAKSTVLVDLKIACEMRKLVTHNLEDGNSMELYNYISYTLVPRSSIYKTPLRMANSIGIVDSHYRGTLRTPLDNIRDEDYLIKKGTRLFQIVAFSGEQFKVTIVDKLSETERGEGGFGSTGA